MGAAFRKAFRTPVAVDNWDSLQREARRIHDSLEALLRESPPLTKRELRERNQAVALCKNQWFRIYSLLHNFSKSAEDEYTSLTSDVQYQWLIIMKNKMDVLLQQVGTHHLASIPEGFE